MLEKEQAIRQAINAYNRFIGGGLVIRDITSFRFLPQ